MYYQPEETADTAANMITGDLLHHSRIENSHGQPELQKQDQAVAHAVSIDEAPLARVLVVEDNNEIRYMMSLVLEQRCEVDAVGTFDGALNHIDNEDYDVIFVDIDLGEHRTGVDLVKWIKNQDYTHRTSLVACTAYAMPGDREKFLQEGFDYYIGKPFTEKDLLNALEKARSAETS